MYSTVSVSPWQSPASPEPKMRPAERAAGPVTPSKENVGATHKEQSVHM